MAELLKTETKNVEKNALQIYLGEISKVPLLTSEQEQDYVRRMAERDESARETLINSNLRFVVRVAKGYQNLGLPLEDMISEGNIGLMKILPRFNPERSRLITYATHSIMQHIQRAIKTQSKTVRFPDKIADNLTKIKHVEAYLSEELDSSEVSAEDIAEELNFSADYVRKLLQLSRLVSLDQTIAEEEGGVNHLVDLIPDESSESEIYCNMTEKCLAEDMDKAMTEVLSFKERQVIKQRYGLFNSRPKNLEEIGKNLNMTPENVRLIQRKALGKLRECEMAKNLREYLD